MSMADSVGGSVAGWAAAVWRISVVLALMGLSYTVGEVRSNHAARLESLEASRTDINRRSEFHEERLRAIEAIQAGMVANIDAVRSSGVRIEQMLEKHADRENSRPDE